MPLGGVGEFGCNCMAVRYGEDMILVDTGMGFPQETAYGVDVEVPDFDFLEDGKVTNRGSETWQMVRAADGWKIAAMLYSAGR